MSNPTITPDEFAAEARAWLDAHFERRTDTGPGPRGGDRGHTGEVAADRILQRQLHEAGFAGITWPVEVGGRGLSPAHEHAFAAVARDYVMPDFGVAGGTTFGVCGPVLCVHASDSFKAEHMPRILAGEELWVQFFSEPVAGSDLAGIRTTAVRDGDEWILNGQKVWTSGAFYGDWGLCLARTDWNVPKHRGLTWFCVPIANPGVTVLPIREISGHAEFCEVFLDDVRIPADHIVGEENQGWTVTNTMLTFERTAGESESAQGPRRLAADLVALARRSGRLDDPRIRELIGGAHVHDVVQDVFARRLEALVEAGSVHAGHAAYGKLGMGTYEPMRARLQLEIGGTGTVAWSPDDDQGGAAAIEYLNGRVMAIAGGTNEMQRNGISEKVLGLPREPAVDLDRPFSEVIRSASAH